MNLDYFNNGEKIKNAIAAAEDILTKTEATTEEIMQARDALDEAIKDIEVIA